mgnify:CR=1 FL=1
MCQSNHNNAYLPRIFDGITAAHLEYTATELTYLNCKAIIMHLEIDTVNSLFILASSWPEAFHLH